MRPRPTWTKNIGHRRPSPLPQKSSLHHVRVCSNVCPTAGIALKFLTVPIRPIYKHPKNWETALWGKVRLYWKKGSIERKALLKERLYWKKGLIETNSKIWSKFQNLVQVLKFGWNSEIWPNIWNFAKNVKFGGNSEIWLKFGLESSKSTICPPPPYGKRPQFCDFSLWKASLSRTSTQLCIDAL